VTGRDATPEVRSAIIKFAIAEGLLMAVAVVLYLVFGILWIIVAAAVLSGAIGLFLILQARAPNDK
jgi:hypothetical protein